MANWIESGLGANSAPHDHLFGRLRESSRVASMTAFTAFAINDSIRYGMPVLLLLLSNGRMAIGVKK